MCLSTLTLLVGWQEGHLACKNWVVGCWHGVEWGADLYIAQLMPLPFTVSCISKIQIGFTFLVPAHPGTHGKRAIKWVCVIIIVFITLGVTLCDLWHCKVSLKWLFIYDTLESTVLHYITGRSAQDFIFVTCYQLVMICHYVIGCAITCKVGSMLPVNV